MLNVIRITFGLLLLGSFGCLISTVANAQENRWIIGTGITYCSYIDNPGLNVNDVTIGILFEL